MHKGKSQDKVAGKNLWDRRTLSHRSGENCIPRDIECQVGQNKKRIPYEMMLYWPAPEMVGELKMIS